MFFVIQCVDAADDYDMAYFGEDAKIEFTREKFSATVGFANSHEELQLMWKAVQEPTSKKYNWVVKGFTLVAEELNKCIVVVPKFEHWDERDKLAILGHEILHCMGASHPAPIK